MRKIILLFAILVVFVSCKEEVVEKPDRLIEKEKMVDIMYDLSILDGIKYQNPASLAKYNINPSEYIYKKYKVDSLQFAQSNVYYASNYTKYKDIFDEIIKRIDERKVIVDSLVLIDVKKKVKLDSINLLKKNRKTKDSLLGLKIKSREKLLKFKDSALIK